MRRGQLLAILAGLLGCAIGAWLLRPAAGVRGGRVLDAAQEARRMLQAIAAADHAAFVANGGGEFRKISDGVFLRLAEQNAVRVRQGYELKAVDRTMKRDVEITRWRVVFTNGSRDATLTLGVSGGTVRLFSLW